LQLVNARTLLARVTPFKKVHEDSEEVMHAAKSFFLENTSAQATRPGVLPKGADAPWTVQCALRKCGRALAGNGCECALCGHPSWLVAELDGEQLGCEECSRLQYVRLRATLQK
jgi:hypothetical protein